MLTNEGEMVVLVRVAPYGKFEEIFMNDWKKLKEELKVSRYAVQLYDLFGWTMPNGDKYTQYVLHFNSEDDLNTAFDKLRDYFYDVTITNDFMDYEMIPEIVWARERLN